MNNNGYVWAIVEKINNIDKNKKNVINTPSTNNFATKIQILQGFNRSNISAIRTDLKLFKTNTTSANLSFIDLEPGTNYGVFYMASNEGTKDFRRFTEVKWISVSTMFEYNEKLVFFGFLIGLIGLFIIF